MKIKIVFLLFIFLPMYLNAQDLFNGNIETIEDIDSLFENDDADGSSGESSKDVDKSEDKDKGEGKKDEDILSNLVNKKGFELGGSFNCYAGYSPGFNEFPEFSDPETAAVLGMYSKLHLDIQAGEHFRFYQSFITEFPEFDPEISEFFFDYDIDNNVFFRLGMFNLTWGVSKNYKFTNLPSRLPDNFGANNDSIDNEDSYAVKMNLPIGIGGLEVLVLTRNGYMKDNDSPAMDEIGFGGNYNLALKDFDLTAGGFYHSDLNMRGYISLEKTLLENLEFYTEVLASYDIENDDVELENENEYSNRFDKSADIGLILNLFDDDLYINAEYFYNGEETELEIAGQTFPLVKGHNIAGGIKLKLLDKKLNPFSHVKYSMSEKAGILIPGFTVDVFPNLSLKFALPMILGSKDSVYFKENPDNLDREVSFIFMAKLSGSI